MYSNKYFSFRLYTVLGTLMNCDPLTEHHGPRHLRSTNLEACRLHPSMVAGHELVFMEHLLHARRHQRAFNKLNLIESHLSALRSWSCDNPHFTDEVKGEAYPVTKW